MNHSPNQQGGKPPNHNMQGALGHGANIYGAISAKMFTKQQYLTFEKPFLNWFWSVFLLFFFIGFLMIWFMPYKVAPHIRFDLLEYAFGWRPNGDTGWQSFIYLLMVYRGIIHLNQTLIDHLIRFNTAEVIVWIFVFFMGFDPSSAFVKTGDGLVQRMFADTPTSYFQKTNNAYFGHGTAQPEVAPAVRGQGAKEAKASTSKLGAGVVIVENAYLYSAANGAKKIMLKNGTQSHLINGDNVNIIGYSGNFTQVEFTGSRGKKVYWTPQTSVKLL